MLAQIVLFDGFDPLDAIAPYEVLSAGGMLTGGNLTVQLVSAEGAREVPSGLAGSVRSSAPPTSSGTTPSPRHWCGAPPP